VLQGFDDTDIKAAEQGRDKGFKVAIAVRHGASIFTKQEVVYVSKWEVYIFREG
jgi:hypothetical protein